MNPVRAVQLCRAAALGCGLLAGCSDSDVDRDVSPPPFEIVLGTGEAAFEPFEGEPDLPLSAGVQGGMHVWASFLVYGSVEDRVHMELSTTLVDVPDSTLVMRATVRPRPALDADGASVRSFAGWPAQIDNARCAHGQRVRLDLSVSPVVGAGAGVASAAYAPAIDSRLCVAQVPAQLRATDCDF
jgi:hypothetical protein